MRRTVSLLTFSLILLLAPSVFAQATRTWVSGVGDDANPCSRTAPCKTFAGAISKTAAGGEISVLDPGGFGAVTITKSMTINGAGTLASILFSGTNGVIVNGAGITVNLVDISFNGGTPSLPGVSGIRIIQAAHVSVSRCDIFNYSNAGIRDERTVAGSLTVTDTRIHDPIGTLGTATGIIVGAGASATANLLTCVRCTIFNNKQASSSGIQVSQGGQAFITNSQISNNTRGIFADNSGAVDVTVVSTGVFNNGEGLRARGGIIRIHDVTITRSTVNGIAFAGGVVDSFDTNNIAGNTGNNGAGIVLIPGGQQ